MRLERVPVSHVDVPSRLRAVDAAKVKALSESIEAIGLQTPITLYQSDPDQEGFQLIAGAHRLEAARLLGWEWIDAFFMKGDDIDRQIWEIDENLMRSELSAVQMAEHLAKRKELWEARQSAQVAPIESLRKDGKGHRKKQFASDTSEKAGVSKATVNRAVSRATSVCQEARDLIRDTKLNNGTFLDKLKAVPVEDQVAFARCHLERLERPANKPVKAPDPDNDLIVKERQVSALMAAWNKAGKDAREAFLERIETPITGDWH